MTEEPLPNDLMEKVVNLCKRRGFVFPSAEIYGGFRSTYDYGPLGVNMLRNVRQAWWRTMVQLREDALRSLEELRSCCLLYTSPSPRDA